MREGDRKVIGILKAVRDQNAAGILARNPAAVPTKFVSWFQLNWSFGVTKASLERLVKAGCLTAGESSGSGPEYAAAGE